MKFVDKYAIVPIDRYNYLIKHFNINEQNISSEEQSGSGSGKEKIVPDENPNSIIEKKTTEEIIEPITRGFETNIKTDPKETIQSDIAKKTVEDNETKETIESKDNKVNKISDSNIYNPDSSLHKPVKLKIKHKKKQKINNILALPPGIPNKRTKKHSKWVKLF
jgi:hypothetical protein